MKKLLFVLYLIFSLYSIGAEIEGMVKVEEGENFGVFVYIKNEMKYDITDASGKFVLGNLELNKEYNLILQKDEMPDYEIKILLKEEKQKIKIDLKKTGASNKYITKGTIISNKNSEIFLKFVNKKYGIIVEPRKAFYRKLEVGNYETEIIQKGTYKKKINFEVEPKKENDIGIHYLKEIEQNSLDILLKNKIDNGYIYLYKNGRLEYTRKLINTKKLIKISDLEKGKYTFELKAYGYKDYEKTITINGKEKTRVYLEKEELKNKFSLKIYPEDIKVDLKLFEKDILFKEEKDISNQYEFKGMDKNKEYRVEIEADKYKKYIIPRIKVSDKNIEISLIRNISGIILEGNIYPYSAGSQIMLLEDGNILGKTKQKENGYYKFEVDEIKSGQKTLRIRAEGFDTLYKKIDIKKGNRIKQINIELKPIVSTVFGKVKLENIENCEDVLIVIEELNLWQKTNIEGEYFFSNLPIGKYTLDFKKIGYNSKKVKVEVKEKEVEEINLELIPKSKLIIHSNQKEYKLNINGKEEIIEKFVFEKELSLGIKKIIVSKEGYLDYKNNLGFNEPGEIKEIKIDFESLYNHKMKLKSQLNEIEKLIEKLEVREAEKRIYEVEKLKNINIYIKRLNELKIKLKKSKVTLYKTDKEINEKILELKNNLKELNKKDIGYAEKEREIIEMKQKIIDVLQKILKEKPYTMLKENIYVFLGELYLDLGMIETSEWNYKKANEYKSR